MDHDDEIEIDGARLIHKKRVWVPSGRSVSFVAKSLHISCRQNVLATDGKLSTSINGDIYVDSLGILVIGLHDKGRHQLALNIDAADDDWLNKPISDLDSGLDGRLIARANLHHSAGDPELDIDDQFSLSIYFQKAIFDLIVSKIHEKTLNNLWFRCNFFGLYSDFEYGMSHHVTLGLRRGTHTSEPAVGYLTGWGWDENEVNCAEPVWLKKRLAWGTDARPDQNEHTPIGSSSQAAGATTKNTEKLLAQLAVGVRWIGWALAALAAAIIYHAR